jgi:triphosphatase
VDAMSVCHEPLQGLVKALRLGCHLEPAADNKYSQGLKSVGLTPVQSPAFEPTDVDSSMQIDAVALANLRRYLSAWHRHEPGARLGDDPEELHELRVAGRRLDATLRQFTPFLTPTLVGLRPTLKKLLRALGAARDLDLALLEIDSFRGKLAETDRSNLEPLRGHLHSERARARNEMLGTLDSQSVQQEFEKLTEALAQPRADAGNPQQTAANPAVNVIAGLVCTRYKRVRRAANRLTAHSSMDEYHAVRGRAKKLRYLIEAIAGIVGKPADDMVRALRRWQERLGVQQDADVAGRRLQALANKPPQGLPPETLFLMGQLAAHHERAAYKARKRHPRAYRKVRARWKALKCKLTELTPDTASLQESSGP